MDTHSSWLAPPGPGIRRAVSMGHARSHTGSTAAQAVSCKRFGRATRTEVRARLTPSHAISRLARRHTSPAAPPPACRRWSQGYAVSPIAR